MCAVAGCSACAGTFFSLEICNVFDYHSCHPQLRKHIRLRHSQPHGDGARHDQFEVAGASNLCVRCNRAENRKRRCIGGITTITRFGYDESQIWVDMNSSNSLTVRYLRTDQLLELLANLSASAASWLLADRMGSIRNVVNSRGRNATTQRVREVGHDFPWRHSNHRRRFFEIKSHGPTHSHIYTEYGNHRKSNPGVKTIIA